MNSFRILEIQGLTAYPQSGSVHWALLKVWNEVQQENDARVALLESLLRRVMDFKPRTPDLTLGDEIRKVLHEVDARKEGPDRFDVVPTTPKPDGVQKLPGGSDCPG